ncbi:MAG TPA: nitronate monooxygenase, partial [Niabella sp.]|nr:nitronate monooxygenase [Niabella sp.]
MKRRTILKTFALTGALRNLFPGIAAPSPFKKKKMWNETKLTKLLGIDFPIVQGPFGGCLSSVNLTSTVSNAGALGSFGGQPFSAQEIIETGYKIRKHTNKPFNINLWVNDRDSRLDSFDNDDYKKLTALFKPYFDELGLSIPDIPTDLGPKFEDQVEAIFEVKPAVFSFVYGIPSQTILEKCKQLGIKTIGAATTVDEAIALQNAGVDAIIATGFEAGGHRVSFLQSAEDSLTGTFALIPQVA